jgi:hypothetical protein
MRHWMWAFGILALLTAISIPLGHWLNSRPYNARLGGVFVRGEDRTLSGEARRDSRIGFNETVVQDTVWLSAYQQPEFSAFLLDLRTRQVLCTLRGFYPIGASPSEDRILVLWKREQRFEGNPFMDLLSIQTKATIPFKQRLLSITLSTGTVKELAQFRGHDSRHHGLISPDGRYAFYLVSMESAVLVDLRTEQLLPAPANVNSSAVWWSEHELAYRDQAGNWVVYDLLDASTRELLTQADFNAGLQHCDIRDVSSKHPMAIASNSYDIHFKIIESAPNARLAHLLRMNKATLEFSRLARPLSLVGTVSPDGRFILDRPENNGSQPKMLLTDTLTSTSQVIEQNTQGKNGWSLARFYGERIFYIENDILWNVDPETLEKTQVFPANE